LAALVANSCKDTAKAWAVLGSSKTAGPSISTRKATLNRFLKEKTVTDGFASWLRYHYYTDDKMILRAYAPEDIGRFNGLVGFFRRYGEQYGFDYLMSRLRATKNPP
jgi:hypothetical protein